MSKPRYPAHLFHKLRHYPRKTCEVCGHTMLPHLNEPNRWNNRQWLEPLQAFKRRRTCGHKCGNVLTMRARQAKRVAALAGPTTAPTTEAAAPPPPPQPKPAPRRLEPPPAPRFPTPRGFRASQLDIGHAYAQPSGTERPIPTRRQKPRPSKLRPIPDQVADLITRTKGRPFKVADIAKAFDLTEPEADSLLLELATDHQIRRRVDPLGRPLYESLRP